MSGKDKLEHIVEEVLHHERETARWQEVKRKARAHDYALHYPTCLRIGDFGRLTGFGPRGGLRPLFRSGRGPS